MFTHLAGVAAERRLHLDAGLGGELVERRRADGERVVGRASVSVTGVAAAPAAAARGRDAARATSATAIAAGAASSPHHQRLGADDQERAATRARPRPRAPSSSLLTPRLEPGRSGSPSQRVAQPVGATRRRRRPPTGSRREELARAGPSTVGAGRGRGGRATQADADPGLARRRRLAAGGPARAAPASRWSRRPPPPLDHDDPGRPLRPRPRRGPARGRSASLAAGCSSIGDARRAGPARAPPSDTESRSPSDEVDGEAERVGVVEPGVGGDHRTRRTAGARRRRGAAAHHR